MNLRRFYIVSVAALAIQIVVAAWGLAQVGLDAQVPSHWNAAGEIDGYSPAWFAFLLIPAITAGIVGLLALIPRIEPRRENLRRSAGAYRTAGNAVILLMTMVQAGIVLAGTGRDVPMASLMGFGIGALFIVLGNVMTTVRSNFMFGVRTPWTLSSDRAWDRTHRFVGRVFVVGGLALMAVSLLGEPVAVFGVMLGFIGIAVVGGYVYSYRVWKADPDRRPAGSGS